MQPSNKEITINSYQLTAKDFAANVVDLASMESIQKFIELLPPHAKMIDIGCGSGRDAKLFSEKGIEVFGIDYCSNLLDIAIEHAKLASFQLMDIENMHVASESFDGAWAACSLGHFSKETLPNILKQIHLLLKENGCFYLSLKKGTGELLEIDSRYEGEHKKFWAYYEENEIKNILEAANFKILHFKLIKKSNPYLTHDAFRIFCQKI